MTVNELSKLLGCTAVTGGFSEAPVTGGYCGDLLSWVMSRAHSGDAWVTVMGNVNTIAVAVLTGVACVILAEGAQPDADAVKKAGENGVALLRSERTAFELAGRIREALRP